MRDLPSREAWNAAVPFPSCVTEWPWNRAELDAVVAAWPADDDPHWTPHRNEKRSYRSGGTASAATVDRMVARLHSQEFLDALTKMTGIVGLRTDPHLYGGGLHETKPGGRLGMHVDFNHAPELGWRRLNVLVYLNTYVPDRSGDLRLESDDGKDVRRISPRMGTMVVFGTTDVSWHGHPAPLTWDLPRRSFAAYYYAPVSHGGEERPHSTIYRDEHRRAEE